MSPFALIRPLIAKRREWLPQLALPTAMFIALLALGGDRGYLYRDGGGHNWETVETLLIAENLSPDHNFRLIDRVWRDEDGGFQYEFYSRFPIGGFALVKLATMPFGDDLAAQLLAARLLSLLAFCGAALLAYLAIARIARSRAVALAATLLAFSGFYAIYYADALSGETVLDVFGAALAFHGMTVFVQEGRFRQLIIKTCAALLIGWHVYALLLPFIAIGLGGEALALIRAPSSASGKAGAVRRALSALAALARSRFAALAAVSILFGASLLAFNVFNEYTAYEGETALSDLPIARALFRRFGQTDHYEGNVELRWGNFLRRQFYRVGEMSTPYAVARYAGYDFESFDAFAPPLIQVGWGVAATCAAMGALAFARRRQTRVLLATAALFGFCWSIPMRHTTFYLGHFYEALPYLWLALALFAAALIGARRLLRNAAAIAAAAIAAAIFALSVFHVGRIDQDVHEAKRWRAEMAEFSAMRETTRGKRVGIFPVHTYNDRHAIYYYLAGGYMKGLRHADACDPGVADFAVSPYRVEIPNLRSPDNRHVFLYEDVSQLELCEAERRRLESSEPAARSTFDVYLQDRALSYLKAPCEPSDYETPFYRYVYPVDPNDLPARFRRDGFHPTWETVRIENFGARVGDACLMTLRLPDYPIAAIRTGQWLPGVERIWDVFVTPPPDADARAFYESAYQTIAASGEPAARSDFDLYLQDDTLSYLKEPCDENDARGRFFLSVHPTDVQDLPPDRRDIGHDSLNFTFAPPAGVVFDGKCMATRQLPDYDIEKIQTGQWIPGGDRLWDAEIAIDR